MQNVYRWYFLISENLAHTFAIKSSSVDEALNLFSTFLNSNRKNRKEYTELYRLGYYQLENDSIDTRYSDLYNLYKPFRVYKDELEQYVEVFNFKGDVPEGFVYSGNFAVYKPDLTKMIVL